MGPVPFPAGPTRFLELSYAVVPPYPAAPVPTEDAAPVAASAVLFYDQQAISVAYLMIGETNMLVGRAAS